MCTHRRSLSLSVYEPLHCVLQAQTNIVHLLICHAQEIALSMCTHPYITFSQCVQTLHRFLSVCSHPYISSQCVLTFTLCVSGADKHRAPVDLSRAGDRDGCGRVVRAYVPVRLLPIRGRTRAKRGPQRQQTQEEEKEERLPPGSVYFCLKFFQGIIV